MKIIISTLFLLMFSIANTQNITIPDENFKAYLLGNSSINTDGNTDEISNDEAIAFTGTINCNGKSIKDLTGIKHFVNITGLICDWNELESLDVSNNLKIETLKCDYNRKLVSLNLGNNDKLTFLNCSGNKLTTLNLLTVPNLEDLECSSNALSELNLSKNAKLETLECYRNQLKILDVSKNLLLRHISCENNLIENIDISVNTKLSSLDCRNNKLKTLNIDNGKNLFFNLFKASGNSDLSCIQVDNLANVRRTTWKFDPEVNFSTDCKYTASNDNVTLDDSVVKVHPNPASEIVTVESSKSIETLNVFSVNGTLIKTFYKPTKVNVSNWSKGTYFFDFKIENKHLTKKIIIK